MMWCYALLEKDGWKIEGEQYAVDIDGKRIWIDIHASHTENTRLILVEVKSFVYVPSPIVYISAVLGKYSYYRAILEHEGIKDDLYLAVPLSAYEGVMSERINSIAIADAQPKIIVFDVNKERIVEWID